MCNNRKVRPYILAVDNEGDFLMLLKKGLGSRGYEVATLINPAEVWATVARKHPDVIFLDIQMNGIHGGDLCIQLKKDPATASIPVVLSSASHNVAEVANVCGADGFVSKPYNTEKIVSQLEKILA